jgi:YidC/Oxa1 family membrane protein insertase
MFNDQDNQKNLLLAIVLSMAVLLAWQFFYVAPRHKEEQERQARIRQEQQVKAKEQQPAAPGAPKTEQPAQPGATPVPSSAPAPALTREAALEAGPRVGIDAPSLKGSISLKGGRIDDVVLKKYRETVAPGSPHVVLFSPSGAPHPFYAEFGWTAGANTTQPMPNQDTIWRLEPGGPLTPESPVTLTWDNGQGLLFRRTISVDDDYLFKVADEVENKARAACRRSAIPTCSAGSRNTSRPAAGSASPTSTGARP